MDQRIQLELDGRTLEAGAGETILSVARRNGVQIPTLCHDSRLEPAGACRMCLVEVEGFPRLLPSCATAVSAGMKVLSTNARILRHRKMLLSLYAADLPGWPEAGTTGDQLAAVAQQLDGLISIPPARSPRRGLPANTNPYLGHDPSLCILCARCVRYCDEVAGVSAITLSERGAATTIATAGQQSLLHTTCELCGGCIDTCPTGAMFELKAGPRRDDASTKKVRTTCNYCGVGCQMDLCVEEGQVVKVSSPPPGETINDGNLCVKGRFVYDFIHHEDRLDTPLVRDEHGQLVPASWEEAIQRAVDGLSDIAALHGAESLGFISSSRCTGEENYLMQKLARAAFGSNNVHSCAAT